MHCNQPRLTTMKSFCFKIVAALLLIGVEASHVRPEFQQFEDEACRSNYGDEGSEATGEFEVIRDVSRRTCEYKCVHSDTGCFGFEYSRETRRCEVWKVPIDRTRLSYARGTDCHIKGGSTPNPAPSPIYYTPYPTPDYPDYGMTTHNFRLYRDDGCRTRSGDKGSRGSDFDLFKGVHRDFCEDKCLRLGYLCFGYEYNSDRKRCEVWRVQIGTSKLEYAGGTDCYVRNMPMPEYGSCIDKPGWMDVDGDGCEYYEDYDVPGCPALWDYPSPFGQTAIGACCHCGGGLCTDEPGWRDRFGYGCDWFEVYDEPGCPEYGHISDIWGTPAWNACCFCNRKSAENV